MNQKTNTNTFSVSDVETNTQPLLNMDYREAVGKFILRAPEACSNPTGKLLANVHSHPLIAALHGAFCCHYPIVLSPDIIWLTITQGVASHINLHAEELRHKFVAHEGQVKIKVRRDDFAKGSPHNPWPKVFTKFSEQVRDHIGSTCDLFVADFSTTGPAERAASEIILLDAMQSYFKYELRTCCGIPAITLEGTVEDWQSIAYRAEKLCDHGLQWWYEDLQPILEEFVAAASGNIDRPFWNSIYKFNGSKGSGSPYVSGWIHGLFPYVLEENTGDSPPERMPNPWIQTKPTQGNGPTRKTFPNTTAIAPFKWLVGPEENPVTFDMEFIGGLIGVAQDSDSLALRPEIGWAVCDTASKEPEASWFDRESIFQHPGPL